MTTSWRPSKTLSVAGKERVTVVILVNQLSALSFAMGTLIVAEPKLPVWDAISANL